MLIHNIFIFNYYGGHTHEQPQQAAHPGHVSTDRGGHVTGIGKFCIKFFIWYYGIITVYFRRCCDN
uniref:Candidate secreted effector n=1 Tax=Meloidogyne incognita TaxID=6306 RepID=A0A914LTJ3_MELIC